MPEVRTDPRRHLAEQLGHMEPEQWQRAFRPLLCSRIVPRVRGARVRSSGLPAADDRMDLLQVGSI